LRAPSAHPYQGLRASALSKPTPQNGQKAIRRPARYWFAIWIPSRSRHVGHRVRSRYNSALSMTAEPRTPAATAAYPYAELRLLVIAKIATDAAVTSPPIPRALRARFDRPLKYSRIVRPTMSRHATAPIPRCGRRSCRYRGLPQLPEHFGRHIRPASARDSWAVSDLSVMRGINR
jgi:hypothetical protein